MLTKFLCSLEFADGAFVVGDWVMQSIGMNGLQRENLCFQGQHPLKTLPDAGHVLA